VESQRQYPDSLDAGIEYAMREMEAIIADAEHGNAAAVAEVRSRTLVAFESCVQFRKSDQRFKHPFFGAVRDEEAIIADTVHGRRRGRGPAYSHSRNLQLNHSCIDACAKSRP